jgi:hypothetical protein
MRYFALAAALLVATPGAHAKKEGASEFTLDALDLDYHHHDQPHVTQSGMCYAQRSHRSAGDLWWLIAMGTAVSIPIYYAAMTYDEGAAFGVMMGMTAITAGILGSWLNDTAKEYEPLCRGRQ